MTHDQLAILLIVTVTVGMFMWGRWRHDIVALTSLLVCVAFGLVPGDEAFSGFGHPAVITVACVLILSSVLQSTGAIDALTRKVVSKSTGPTLSIASLVLLSALLSAFMNNVGALALLMPVGLQLSSRLGISPGKVLMPLAFGSILGGMTTLIGTPPNLIVSGFRSQNTGQSFAMFDFAMVGVPVALGGLALLAIVGWRLVPTRQPVGSASFETGAYLVEAHVSDGSKAAGMTLRDIEVELRGADAQVVGLVRGDMQIPAPSRYREVRADDILIIVAEPELLADALSSLELEIEQEAPDKPVESTRIDEPAPRPENGDQRNLRSMLQSDDVDLMEIVIRPHSRLVGRSASEVRLREQHGINLLAVSREGHRSVARLKSIAFNGGDVLLVQGRPEVILEFSNRFGCIPLAERPLRVPDPKKALMATLIMAVAVAGAAFGLMPAAVAFAAGVLSTVFLRLMPVRQLYDAIDWPVIVLLAALIPVAGAIASSGAAEYLAKALLGVLPNGGTALALATVLILTMVLSDFMNNAATAAVMCPIAMGIATQLGITPEPFLMAVAVGASCAFLTPIGHQNNTLILGPSGFKFGDYWRLGLILELVVLVIGVPMIMIIWLS
jgi:di/tricarboxylate transporter